MSSAEAATPAHTLTLQQRCQPLDMLLLDVDGVLTDGQIIYADNEVEIKAFHVRDGSGLKIWQLEGKQAGIITGRSSPVVEMRGAELGLKPILQGAADKLQAFRDVVAKAGLTPRQVCFIGDDLPDLPILCQCGLAVAVADACPDVRAAAHYVTQLPGGRGAVRETIELILRCQGRWQKWVDHYCQPAGKGG